MVEADRFDERIDEVASALGTLDIDAQVATKRRLRAPMVERLRKALDRDRVELRGGSIPLASTPPV